MGKLRLREVSDSDMYDSKFLLTPQFCFRAFGKKTHTVRIRLNCRDI